MDYGRIKLDSDELFEHNCKKRIVDNPMDKFKNMSEILEERHGERFHVVPFTISKEACEKTKFASLMNGSYEYYDLVPGTYVKLYDAEKDEIVMSDTPMERRTNCDLVEKAVGKVLIGGLGIGMVLMAIQDKPEVKSITVIEKYKEVIDLVGAQLPLNDKVKIINDDVFKWTPEGHYDTIYMDIWNVISGDYWCEHVKLSRKYQYTLNRGNERAWKSSWRKKDFRRLAY